MVRDGFWWLGDLSPLYRVSLISLVLCFSSSVELISLAYHCPIFFGLEEGFVSRFAFIFTFSNLFHGKRQ